MSMVMSMGHGQHEKMPRWANKHRLALAQGNGNGNKDMNLSRGVPFLQYITTIELVMNIVKSIMFCRCDQCVLETSLFLPCLANPPIYYPALTRTLFSAWTFFSFFFLSCFLIL